MARKDYVTRTLTLPNGKRKYIYGKNATEANAKLEEAKLLLRAGIDLDNDTTVGWYGSVKEEARDRVRRYLNCDGGNVSWDFIRLAMSSIAKYAIYPMQDVLKLGSEARMNVPGVLGANWAWRFEKEDLQEWHAIELKKMTQLFNR